MNFFKDYSMWISVEKGKYETTGVLQERPICNMILLFRQKLQLIRNAKKKSMNEI